MYRKSILENFLDEVDVVLRTLFPPKSRITSRLTPAQTVPESNLTNSEKKQIASLMRVNHAGEVCAQALYRSQALTARVSEVKVHLEEAAKEEIDHLAWCEQRLRELDSQPSRLNLVWYMGSFLIGFTAGIAGDRWSLGFLAETEQQVSEHLEKHLALLPSQDKKTKVILTQMEEDERQHAQVAYNEGAAPLPFFIKFIMQGTSKIMTSISYYV